jgi:hypothetical protein
MALNGHRCQKQHVDGKLCFQHRRFGAIVPDGWTATGLPVVMVRRVGDTLIRVNKPPRLH